MSKVLVLTDLQHRILQAMLLSVDGMEVADKMELGFDGEFREQFVKMQGLLEEHSDCIITRDGNGRMEVFNSRAHLEEHLRDYEDVPASISEEELRALMKGRGYRSLEVQEHVPWK